MKSTPTMLRSGVTRLKQAGFTLFEMIIALSMFVLLIGGIYSISQGTLELTDGISRAQERAEIRRNFIEFIRRSYRTLPKGAEIRVTVRPKGGSYVPTITVINGGSSFTPGRSLPPNTSVEMYTEEQPGGYLRVMLRELDDVQTRAVLNNQAVRASKDQVPLPLMGNVSRFEWRFYDPTTNRWENNWKNPKLPLLAEMNLQLDDGFETRAVFWLPPVR